LAAMTYGHGLSAAGTGRLSRGATTVRNWCAVHAGEDVPPGARPWTTDPRWGVFGWLLVAVPVAPAVSFGIAAVF
jgi:hypothetical protein